MIITYLGNHCLKLQLADTTIAINPPATNIENAPNKFGADVVLCSSAHPLFHGTETASHGDKNPFIIDGPGEYELPGLMVTGTLTESMTEIDGKNFPNTSFVITFDGIKVAVIGAIDSPEKFIAKQYEILGDADMVITPLFQNNLGLQPQAAFKVARGFEPALIIPTYNKDKQDLLNDFKKQASSPDTESVAKLTIKPKDVSEKNATIAILEY